jgi:hypothetical protein
MAGTRNEPQPGRKWLRGMDSNHDNQLQRLVSYRLDDPGIVTRHSPLHDAVDVSGRSIVRVGILKKRMPRVSCVEAQLHAPERWKAHLMPRQISKRNVVESKLLTACGLAFGQRDGFRDLVIHDFDFQGQAGVPRFFQILIEQQVPLHLQLVAFLLFIECSVQRGLTSAPTIRSFQECAAPNAHRGSAAIGRWICVAATYRKPKALLQVIPRWFESAQGLENR